MLTTQASVAVGLDRGVTARDALLDPGRRGGHADPPGLGGAVSLGASALQLPLDVGGGVAARDRPPAAAPADPHAAADPVDAERAPVVAVEIERDQVPAMAAVDDRGRLGLALRRAVVTGDVGEPQLDAVAAGAGDLGQQVGVDLRLARS